MILVNGAGAAASMGRSAASAREVSAANAVSRAYWPTPNPNKFPCSSFFQIGDCRSGGGEVRIFMPSDLEDSLSDSSIFTIGPDYELSFLPEPEPETSLVPSHLGR